jgi:hypothetical protein
MYIWHIAKGPHHGPTDNVCSSQGWSWYPRWLRSLHVRASMRKRGSLPSHDIPTTRSQKSSSWIDNIRSLRIFLPRKEICEQRPVDLRPRFWPLISWFPSFPSRLKVSSANNPTQIPLPEPLPLSALGIEAELSPEPCYIFNGTPKRIRKQLVRDPSCKIPPAGWGLWMEEDFIIPGRAVVLINIIPAAVLPIAVGLSIRHGLTWLSLATYAVGLTPLIFAQWITLTKDSKG